MNERIRQLADEAGITDNNLSDGNMSHDDLAKFARLIVMECASKVDNILREKKDGGGTMGDEIKQHFGVEE